MEKYFLRKGGIKREKEGFGRMNLYFFKNFQRGGEEFETLWVNVFLGYGLGREREKGERDRVFGLRRRWVNIYYI